MRTAHIFAGAGGGLLADLILGHTPILAVEWDSYACQVLRERAADGWFPDLHVWEGDVRLFDPSEYAGRVDCIHAGFPCQDISVAGNQAGVGEETRSGLYREVLRIARVVRPQYLYLENVAAIVSNGLGTVATDLAALGYDAEWLCLRASDCGAPHHRDRWWCFAYTNELRHTVRAASETWSAQENIHGVGTQNERGWDELVSGSGWICSDVSDPDSNQRCPSSVGQDSWADGRNNACGIREVLADANIARCERYRNGPERRGEEYAESGVSSWWQVEPNVGRVANGVAHRIHRLKALGNGQVPLQAAVAFKLLMDSIS